MSTTPLMDMTDTDLKQLSTAIMTEFTNAGFMCPENARTMFALGKLSWSSKEFVEWSCLVCGMGSGLVLDWRIKIKNCK